MLPAALQPPPPDRQESAVIVIVSASPRAATLLGRLAAVAIAVVSLCASQSSGAARPRDTVRIAAIGAENEYADVIAQVGGHYVTVGAVESNPSVDPHSFEASPSVAREVAAASLIVQNGLGYDSYMDRIESGSPSPHRRIITVQALLRLPDSTPNPHLWYQPSTMSAVAAAVAGDLAALAPAHASYFRANATAFDRSLQPLRAALRAFASRHTQVPLAVTEPVGDYLLAAAGARVLTPMGFQDDIMNGVDPAPQDVSFEQALLAGHRVKALLYNRQVTDALTASFLTDAARARIPVVALYETMPAGYHYQSWMLAELRALDRAVSRGVSTEQL
jgi:zinc/manganese transport system substrate-binding protein